MANRYRVHSSALLCQPHPVADRAKVHLCCFFSISSVAFTLTVLCGAWVQILCESESFGAQSLGHDDLLLAKPSTTFE